MISAKGPVSFETAVDTPIPGLGVQELIVLPNSPRVLSVGRLIEQGYSFHWIPLLDQGGKFLAHYCILRNPSGAQVQLDVVNRVPLFNDVKQAFSTPSARDMPNLKNVPKDLQQLFQRPRKTVKRPRIAVSNVNFNSKNSYEELGEDASLSWLVVTLMMSLLCLVPVVVVVLMKWLPHLTLILLLGSAGSERKPQ